jgi:hypothetical protein
MYHRSQYKHELSVHIYAGFIRKAGYITKMAVPPTHKRLQAFENTMVRRMSVKKMTATGIWHKLYNESHLFSLHSTVRISE